MQIRSLCNTQVITVREGDELVAASALMREQHVGYLVVVESSRAEGPVKPIGILTDRDIVVGILAKGVDPQSVTVGDVMTRRPVVLEESQSFDAALEAMRRIGVRRIPVVAAGGQLIGVLSLDEVVEHLARQLLEVSSCIRSELNREQMLRA
jgi:CBS domain-containing protein